MGTNPAYSVVQFSLNPALVLICRDIQSSIDLFDNGSLLLYSFVGVIISLSDLISMWKIQKNSYFQTRSERLSIIRIKEYNNRLPLSKRSILLRISLQINTFHLFHKNISIGRHYERGLQVLGIEAYRVCFYSLHSLYHVQAFDWSY